MPAERQYQPVSKGLPPIQTVGRVAAWVLWGLWLVVLIAIVPSMTDYVRPEQVAVIKNNLTGAESVRLTDGLVVHAPLGITRVYVLDKVPQTLRMTARRGVGDRPGIDNVRTKTSDGTNIFVDVEAQYRIKPAMAQTVVRTFGRGNAYKLEYMRSLVRSRVRDALGELSLVEIAEAGNRQSKATQAMQSLNDAVSSLGIEMTMLSITDLDFSEEYKTNLTERVRVRQDVINQEAARLTAESEKLSATANVQRRKNTTLEQIKGEQAKRLIDAQGEAVKVLKDAEAEAYRARIEGDQQYQVALNEARALEQEGLRKAEGIRRMAAAYVTGGFALIRETLAKKYTGKRINGKPYTLDSRIERLRIEHEAGAAAVTAPARAKGGQ